MTSWQYRAHANRKYRFFLLSSCIALRKRKFLATKSPPIWMQLVATPNLIETGNCSCSVFHSDAAAQWQRANTFDPGFFQFADICFVLCTHNCVHRTLVARACKSETRHSIQLNRKAFSLGVSLESALNVWHVWFTRCWRCSELTAKKQDVKNGYLFILYVGN